jgi:hypothetical protein
MLKETTRKENHPMSQPSKSLAIPERLVPPDPYPDYRPVYSWLFQAWLIMFLAVICFSLVIYLRSYIPKSLI